MPHPSNLVTVFIENEAGSDIKHTTVEGLPIAFVGQTEAESIDNNVLAVLAGESAPDLDGAMALIAIFVEEFRAGAPDRDSQAGRTLGRDDAVAYIAAGRAAHAARLQLREKRAATGRNPTESESRGVRRWFPLVGCASAPLLRGPYGFSGD